MTEQPPLAVLLTALLAALVGVLAMAPAPAHGAPDASEMTILESDISAYPDVTLTVSVPHDADDPAEQISVAEGGRVRDVQARPLEADELDVAVVVDVSGSMGGEPMQRAREGAADFVERMPGAVDVAVVEFNDDATLLSGLSDDRAHAQAAIDGLEAGGYTALYDGIDVALSELATDEATHRAGVVLADGDDNASARSQAEVAARLATEGASLHAVVLDSDAFDPGPLTQLAEGSGGDALITPEPDELAGLFDDVAGVLERTYLVAYESRARGTTPVTVSAGDRDATTVLELPPGPLDRVFGGLEHRWTPYIAAGMVFLGLCGALLIALRPRKRTVRLSAAEQADAADHVPGIKGLAARLVSAAERRLRSTGRRDGLGLALERAGVQLRPGEYVVLSACIGLSVAAALGLVLHWVVGLAALVATPFVAKAFLRFKAQRRSAAFAERLADVLQMIAGSLRSGYGLLQAVDAVAREADEPVAGEFNRVIVETRLGRDLDDALAAMGERVQVDDFDWVIQALAIHREVGGDLAEVLDAIGATIRDRDRIKRQVKALSAEGRLSAYILLGLPFAVGGFIALTNPGYLTPLIANPMGWTMLGMATVLMTVGTLFIRKIIRPVF